MDTQDKLYISDLTTKTKRGYLCVRIMRKWNYDGNVPGNPIMYVGLVLADEKGNAIYGQISQTDVERLASALIVGQIYTIRKFSVRTTRAGYVPVIGDLMIQFTSFTTITASKVPVEKFPNLIYNLTAFKDIKTTGEAATRYIDILGIVIAEGSPRAVYIKAKDRTCVLKEITMKDLSGEEVVVSLWEDNVQRFELPSEASTNEAVSVVALFCGCLPKKIFNKVHVNAGNACSWYINPDISEAQPFYNSLKDHPVVVVRPLPSVSSAQDVVQPTVLEHKTIAEMNTMDPYEFPEKGCRCTVMITQIPQDQEWWYMGCELCKKRLWNYGGNYYCTACSCSTAIPLYKFQFSAADDTGEARFFCYDVVARQIIRRNCDSLLRSINNAPGLPEQIARAIGRGFHFSVGLTKQSYRSMHDRVYLIDSCASAPQMDRSSRPAPLALEAPAGSALQGATSSSGGHMHNKLLPSPQIPLGSSSTLSQETVQEIQTPPRVPAIQDDQYTPESTMQTPLPGSSPIKIPETNMSEMAVTKRPDASASVSNARKKLKYDDGSPQKVQGKPKTQLESVATSSADQKVIDSPGRDPNLAIGEIDQTTAKNSSEED